MEHKPLGRSGRTISAIGLGCVTFGREIDEEDSYRVMDYAVEKGGTFFDTAAIYGGGQARIERRNNLGFDEPRESTQEMSSSERILGRWMSQRGCRDEIAVTAYSPLGAGFLAGKYTADQSQFPEGSRFHILPDHAGIYFSDENFRTVERLRSKSAELGIPMVKLAMAWVMSHPDVTLVLIGARTTDHINNALAAYEMGQDPELRAELAGQPRAADDPRTNMLPGRHE